MLPTLPYTFSKSEIDTYRFLGINHTENTKEGELSDSLGITLSSYPCIKTREGREKVEGYVSASDIFEFDSHIAVVDNGILYFDGKELSNVTAARKQWAAVNRRIILFPDKIWIDADTGESGKLNAQTVSSGGVVFSDTTLTAAIKPIYKSGVESPLFYEITDLEGNTSRNFEGFYTYSGNEETVAAAFNPDTGEWDLSSLEETWHTAKHFPKKGAIFIPRFQNNTFSPVTSPGKEEYDKTLYNTQGFFAIITNVAGYAQVVANIIEYSKTFTYDVYKIGEGSPVFSSVFSIGQSVDVKTSDGQILAEKVKITALDDEKNSITFSSLTIPTEDVTIIIERHIPDLDFICERENRLWGVSNAERTVYASALGDPAEFWQYDGVSTDSYAVAIGSEGEFTAICSYNSATVIFKEKQVYKILGSYPEEFYMLDYRMHGVQKGCERSLAVINEVLFYKGVFGIYTLTSGTPQLISYNLGNKLFNNAVAACDSRQYTISMEDEDGNGAVYSYDLTHGIWVKTDNARFEALCCVKNTLYMLQNGTVLKSSGADELVEWLCEFVPTCEKTFLQKIFTKLFLCIELQGEMRVEINVDRTGWKQVYETNTKSLVPVTVPLLLPRCHRVQIRLSGTGKMLLREMTRELHAGGGK